MTKREQLARALCKAIGVPADGLVCTRKGGTQLAWETQLPKVDAIIAELREPDERMREIGAWHFGAVMEQLPADDYHEEKAVKCHQAMIDAIE